MYKYKFSKEVQKFLKNRELKFVEKVYMSFEELSLKPFDNNLDIKKLR